MLDCFCSRLVFFLSWNVVIGTGCSSGCQLWFEILLKVKGKSVMEMECELKSLLLLIGGFVPLFPPCRHPGKSILPPPAVAKPNISTTSSGRELACSFVAHRRCFDVSRHSLITRSLSMKLRLPSMQGEWRLDMGAKFACSFARVPA